MRVVIDHHRHELVVENLADGNWWVRFSEREAEARHLDYALADVLRIPRSQAVPIAMTILRQLPPDLRHRKADGLVRARLISQGNREHEDPRARIPIAT